ncbi:glucose-6-phosphate dehydrogenase (coenzyme-F420) [Methyloligella sp. 2.7D]|uniref:glucose-6-phosphate dehydrogenase (coenzyme-F420) n=1 Tax=unclassified Methyloligella TaxID=2625955 RepID=UPI00157DD00D|nr:glucose-6-phosphate dehydrogenase (coenzyme-F420) [Methyloligella sp. GL2]QKP76935.1 glucose-6-phosphate dehydrogenase (coenzyme-F420) [Methyloligella sp. GL2]
MPKIGYKASAEQFAARPLLDFTVLAEELGFDSTFISDHFQPWRHHGGQAPNSIAWLGAAGAMTSRMTLGTSVLTPTFRYHPSIVAQAFATLGAMFPGRVILGVGTGESLNEVPAARIEWPIQKERTARFREAIKLIRELWTEERVSFDGEYYQTERATIYEHPEIPVPIYVAAAGPYMAKLAGRNDGFICTSGKAPELYTETLLPNVATGLEQRKSQAGPFERMIEIKLSFDTDAERALHDTHYWGMLALTPEEKMNTDDPLDFERMADALPIERAASRWIVASDPETAVEKIGFYTGLGFDHLVFHFPGPDQERAMRLFAEHVMPRLR